MQVPTTIQACIAELESDGHLLMLSLADDPKVLSNYVLLSVVERPTAQDIKLLQDGLHLEVNDQLCSGYDLVGGLRLDGARLSIDLTPAGSHDFGIAGPLVADLELSDAKTRRSIKVCATSSLDCVEGGQVRGDSGFEPFRNPGPCAAAQHSPQES